MLFLGFLVALEKQLNRGSVGEFRRLSETAIANVKKFGDRLNLRVNDAEIELGSCAVESFRLGDRVRQGIGGALEIRSEEHTSELQSHSDLVCRLLLEKKNKNEKNKHPMN